MTEAEILQAIKETGIAQIVRDSTWLFGAGEILHFVGLCMLIGSMLVVDLRLLGVSPQIPVRAALAFLPFALIGFVINLITGALFFVADPFLYWSNPSFKLKLILILLAGLNTLTFLVLARRRVLAPRDIEIPGTLTKMIAGLSLGLWLVITMIGRLLPAFES